MAATICHVRSFLLKRPQPALYVAYSQICRLHCGRPPIELNFLGRSPSCQLLLKKPVHGPRLRAQVASLSLWPWSKPEASDGDVSGSAFSAAEPGGLPPQSPAPGAADATLAQPDGLAAAAGYIPEPPSAPPDIAPELLLNALGEPSLASLGLASWYPSGIVQKGLELLHAGLDIPWWGAIVIGTLVVRICMFPLVITSQKNMVNMHNHMPTLQRLIQRINEARVGGDYVQMSRLVQEYTDLQKRYDIRPWRNFLPLLVQLPVFLSVFRGLGAMTNLPVDSMKTGGFLWFKDLTVLDPYYTLPIATALTLLATFELGADSARTASLPPAMKMFMRVLPAIVLVLTMNFPSAMCFYWFTSNSFSLCQVLFLKIPGVKEFFGVPTYVQHQPLANDKGTKKGFMTTFRESSETARVMREMQDRERVNAVNFKQAGLGKPPKTFAYDPTKASRGDVDSKPEQSPTRPEQSPAKPKTF